MTGENAHGRFGEQMGSRILEYEGSTILERQPLIYGHRVDLLIKHPMYGEALVEVKVWRDPRKVGTDNVKKAISDAYTLRARGETRPYILILSHRLTGSLGADLATALEVGAITEVRIMGTEAL